MEECKTLTYFIKLNRGINYIRNNFEENKTIFIHTYEKYKLLKQTYYFPFPESSVSAPFINSFLDREATTVERILKLVGFW